MSVVKVESRMKTASLGCEDLLLAVGTGELSAEIKRCVVGNPNSEC